jgi:hypothetical protein
MRAAVATRQSDTVCIKFGGNRYVSQSAFAFIAGQISHPITILALNVDSTPEYFESQQLLCHFSL